MRAKRSKDTRLVDKFSKRREDQAAETRLRQPVNPGTSDDFDTAAKDDGDLKVNAN